MFPWDRITSFNHKIDRFETWLIDLVKFVFFCSDLAFTHTTACPSIQTPVHPHSSRESYSVSHKYDVSLLFLIFLTLRWNNLLNFPFYIPVSLIVWVLIIVIFLVGT